MRYKKRYLLFTMLALGLGITGINSQLPENNSIGITKAAESDFVINSNGTLTKYNGTDTEIVIPDGVKEIGDRAFYNCTSIKKITIPDSVITIGQKTFWNCKNLAEINIPDSVTTIGSGTFKNCKSLTGIIIPDNVKSIENALFSGCNNLKEIVLPDSITDIKTAAFESCKNLIKIKFPENLVNLGDSAFSGCHSLESAIMPGSLKTIGHWAFLECHSLTSIAIPGNVKTIGDMAFSGCKKLSVITIPDKTTNLGDNIFNNCPALKEITVKTGNKKYITKDGVLFKKEKSSLILAAYPAQKKGTIYKLPAKTCNIVNNAFSGSKKLKEIVISGNMKNLNYCQGAFWGFNNLKNIKINMKKGEKLNIQINLSLFNKDNGNMPEITVQNKKIADIKLPVKDNYFKDNDTDTALVKGVIQAKKNGKAKIVFKGAVSQKKQDKNTEIQTGNIKSKTTLDITVK